MDKYVILNDAMKIENIVVWNGDLSTWQPPENCTYVLESAIDVSQFEWANKGTEEEAASIILGSMQSA